MSNGLAIATATAALQRLLSEAVGVISGATATISRPDTAQQNGVTDPAVNIFSLSGLAECRIS